jgi:crotonobetainyl-CoA:carnitine CoA-transferase CaiB-like acyl-CoA transferase
MYDILDGVRVIEAAAFLQVPTAGGVLADWGADVVKIEHPGTGDPYRALRNDVVQPGTPNPMVQLPNRGKRSVGIDFSKPEGREILYDLIRQADVFITSFLGPSLVRAGLDWETLHEINPRLIYGRSSAYGPRGEEAAAPGYDLAATWARAGFMHQMTVRNAPWAVMQPGSVGDLSGGFALASGVAAALYRRERTGEGMQIDVSLYHTGMWIMAQSIGAATLGIDHLPFRTGLETPRNPLVNAYPTKDNRWIVLCMVQPDRHWADLCRHLDRSDLIEDPRYCDIYAREKNAAELVEVLNSVFAGHDFGYWRERFASLAGPWAPALSPREIAEDPQVAANGYFAEVQADDGTAFRTVASPIQYGGKPLGTVHAMPEVAQHTEEVLLAMGLTWDDLTRLKDAGAIS